MALDAFSVLVAFLAAVEVVLGALAAVLGFREARAPREPGTESRRPLLALVAATLASVALVSAPLLLLLLASWVPRWPGIMCVEGVRRIGTGTVGAARWLPDLVAALDWSRILVVFAAGAWVVLRLSPGARAPRRAAVAACLLGLAGVLDGSAAFAYVVLPKEEVFPSAGCCNAGLRAADRDVGPDPADAGGAAERSRGLAAGFLAASLGFGAGSAVVGRLRAGGRRRAAATGLLAAVAAASLPLAARFLAEVAAPEVLGLPYHRCPWCAFASAPETVAGAALYLGAVLCAGWAAVARVAAAGGNGGGAPVPARFLLGAASFGFLAAAAMGAAIAVL